MDLEAELPRFAARVSRSGATIGLNDLLHGKQLQQKLDDYKVVVIRNCSLSRIDLLVVAGALGTPIPHTLRDVQEAGFPEIMLLSNDKVDGRYVGVHDAGRVWHSDSAFTEHPPAYTMLHAIDVPNSGGHTLFVDMHRAFSRLPTRLIHIAERCHCTFSYRRSYEEKRRLNPDRRALSTEELASLKDVQHRLLKVHPRTGEKALYVNEAHAITIPDLSHEEGRQVLRELLHFSLCTGPDYVHKWQAGDLLVWDNRSVIHRATPYPMDQRRHIRRISIQ